MMARRDYICCKSCGNKLVYDGYDNIRESLDFNYGTVDLICPSCLDALEVKLAKLEQSTAVEPAQAAIKCKDCLDTGEQLGVYGRIKCSCKEPAQAVPVDDEAAFRNYACRCKTLWAGLDWDNQVVEIAREAYLAGRKNSAPPAIDDETRELVLRLCRFVKFNAEHCTPNMNSLAKQIRKRLEAGE